MSIELFDENSDPTVKLVLEIYDTEEDFIPNWWLEVLPDVPATEKHLKGILLSMPAIERQIEKLLELLNES